MSKHRIAYKVGEEIKELIVHVEPGTNLRSVVADALSIAASTITIAGAWKKNHDGSETKVQ